VEPEKPAHPPAWPLGAGSLQRLSAQLVRAAEVTVRAARGIRAERVQVRAMALTYISLFALVPALVVAFSVVQAFTGMDRIAAAVHELLLEKLAVGARASIEPALNRFVTNAHVARAGIVGGVLLVWSGYSLFSNVEGALNDLWEVPRRRSIRMRALVYWMGLTLGPLLLAASAVLGEVAKAYLASGGTKLLAIAAATLLTTTLLTILYLVLPNARVRFRAAVLGALSAGIGWELAKWLFAWFVARFVRYHAIYGSVAAVPVFLTWLYLSWCIVLFGARLAFVVQHPLGAMGSSLESRRGRELLAAQAMVQVATAYQAGKPAPTVDVVVRWLRAGAGALELVEALIRSGLLKPLASGGLVPGRATEAITLLEVRRAVQGDEPPADRRLDGLREILRRADERAEEQLRQTTIRDLCVPVRNGGGPEPAPIGPSESIPTALGS